MKTRPSLLLALAGAALAAALAAAGPPARGGHAVEGLDRTRLLAPAGAEILDYRNAGYALTRHGGEVEIAVDVSPLASRSSFVAPAGPPADAVERLAASLTTGAETQYEAISRILGWMARQIAYDADRSQPQDAEEVLERRSGYCTGVARLAVALLHGAGIPAREVAGYVVGSGVGAVGGYHRWIEAYLPDRGWVFSDPLNSHHYVPATYVRLASEEIVPADGIEGLLLERRDAVTTVDLYPAAVPGIRARRNSPRQLAATLDVRVEDESNGLAVLASEGERRTHALVDGRTTFVGLEPGSYRLLLSLPGGEVLERSVELPGRLRKTLSLSASAPSDRAPSSRQQRGELR